MYAGSNPKTITATLENPLLRFFEKAFAASALHRVIVLETLDGIFQYRERKSLLPLPGKFFYAGFRKTHQLTGLRPAKGRDLTAREANLVFGI
jgi:hypothetical protein